MNEPTDTPTTNQEAYVQEIERRRQNGELDTAVPTTTTDADWTRCHVGSCHRHQECMYTLCRAAAPASNPTTLESRVARLENLIGDHFMLTAHRRRYFKAELLRNLKNELSTLEQSIATHTAERDRLIAEIASYE